METTSLEIKINEFLAQKRIAVVGVSRNRSHHPVGNLIYQRLKTSGHDMLAVNPNMQHYEGDRCYPNSWMMKFFHFVKHYINSNIGSSRFLFWQPTSEFEKPPHASMTKVHVVTIHHRTGTGYYADIISNTVLNCFW